MSWFFFQGASVFRFSGCSYCLQWLSIIHFGPSSKWALGPDIWVLFPSSSCQFEALICHPASHLLFPNLANASRAVLTSTVATGHIYVFNFKLTKVKTLIVSFPAIIVTLRGLSGHKCPVATILDRGHAGLLCHQESSAGQSWSRENAGLKRLGHLCESLLLPHLGCFILLLLGIALIPSYRF